MARYVDVPAVQFECARTWSEPESRMIIGRREHRDELVWMMHETGTGHTNTQVISTGGVG